MRISEPAERLGIEGAVKEKVSLLKGSKEK